MLYLPKNHLWPGNISWILPRGTWYAHVYFCLHYAHLFKTMLTTFPLVSGYNVRRLPYQPGRAHLVCVTQTIGIMVPALQVQQCRQDGSLEKAISGSLHQSSDEVISRKLPRGPGGGRCRNILSNLLEVSFQLCHASNSASAIQRRTREM